jgi:predicted esterase
VVVGSRRGEMKLRIAALCLSMFLPLSAMALSGEQLIPPEKFNAMPDVNDYSSQTEIAATVKSREGVTIRFEGYPPKDDLPIIMFIPGGDWGGHDGLFPVTRVVFDKMGLGGVLIKPPRGFFKVPAWFRETKEHNQDIDAVIRFLRKKYPNNQIWISGSSWGATSAANVATGSTEGVDGVILFSSVSRELNQAGAGPITKFPLSKLKVPVLAVHHRKDSCFGTEPHLADEIVRLARNAPVKKAIYFDGGKGFGDPCKNAHYHGYNGILGEVWTEVGKWVIANYKR